MGAGPAASNGGIDDLCCSPTTAEWTAGQPAADPAWDAPLMDGAGAPPLTSLLSGDDRLNRQYRRALVAALRVGMRPADPLATPLWRARLDALAWHIYWHGQLPPVRRVIDHAIPGPVGPITLRFFYPNRRPDSPLVVYFHGGGFVLNGLTTHERLMRDLAVRARMPVCGVGYALAPEQRFPVQVEEALASVRWIVRHAAQLGVRADRIALGGDSAGASLALSTACGLRDAGETVIAFLVLYYGMFSGDFDTSSHTAFGSGVFGLSTERVRWFWDQYAPAPDDRRNPRAAPLLADLKGLPWTLLIAAGLDCLLDDSLRLADRLQAAGVPQVLSVYDDLPHSFAILAPAVGRADDAVAEVADALRCLHRPAGHASWVARHQRSQGAHRRLAAALPMAAAAIPDRSSATSLSHRDADAIGGTTGVPAPGESGGY